jgi:hypothetical protein
VDPAVGVFASRLGPASYAQCQHCIDQGAEYIDAVLMWVALNGGVESSPEMKHSLISFQDDKYIDWDEISAFYMEREDDILDFAKANFPDFKFYR